MGTEGALLDLLQIRPCLVLFRAKPIGKRLFRHKGRKEIFAFRPRQDSSTRWQLEVRVDRVNSPRFIDLDFNGPRHGLSRHSWCNDISRLSASALTTLKLR